ncbi:unnamed protein product [Spodoptera littoralis]|uniref:Uncharacterized protein n=1 Tax=Spodoptera littoralis TaxID=7109 RepID=A0A9P0N679_SPOLI|nr:unnamed protein product [Spodoptera littoralis]CAH1643009.1 unnamed protein product [Spodoptera littoralis]
MRVLIVAAVLACAAAAPSGLLGASYGHGLLGHAGLAAAHAAPYALAAPLAVATAPLAVAHAAHVAAPVAVAHAAHVAGPALPTISPGDLAGAAIDAHVEAADHVRAAADAAREYHDQASELHGQAINAAEDHSWQAVDAVKTAEAQLDGAAAGAAPVLAKQLAGHVAAAPAALAYGAAHGVAYGAAHGVAYGAAPAVAYSAPALAASKTVVSQSLSQSHPAPVVHASFGIAHAAPYGVAHAAAPVAYAHGLHGHTW